MAEEPGILTRSFQMKKVLFSLIASMTLTATPGGALDMENLLQEYTENNGTPGVAVGLIDQGEIQFFSCGRMSLEGPPVSEDTLFEIGSITKVFTTLALMDMVNKGEVHLDDPVEKYLPEVELAKLKGITLRHLATHTSGLPRWPENCWAPKDPANPYAEISADHLYECLRVCELRALPGTQFEYSNIGMATLGHILSICREKSYEELIQERVAQPLSMQETKVSVNPEMQGQFASGYHLGQEVSHWDLPSPVAGCGALRSNIRDMTKFLAANMGEASLLSQAMQKCHEEQFSPTPGLAVGFGWVLSNSNQAELVWHNGGTGGFRSYLGFNPKTKRGVVILSNSTEDWPDELGLVILDPDYKRPIVDETLAKNTEYLNQFVGSYEVTLPDDLSKQQLQITTFGKLLVSALSGGEVGMLYPESYGVFGVKGFPDGKVYFSFDDLGKVQKVEARLESRESLLWQAVPKF